MKNMRYAAGKLGKMAAVLGVMMWAMGMTSAAEIASVIQIEGPPPQMDRLEERTDHQKEETQMTGELGTNPGKEAAFGPGEVAASNSLGVDVSKLSGAADTDQMVVTVWTQEAAGTQTESERKTESQTQSKSDRSFVKVAYFKKQENGTWTEIFCVPGFCGYNGVSFDKKEGDRQTPAGTFGFVKAFGILPNPGSHFPYKQLDSSDFWVDDSNSRYYNQMVSVNEVVPDWN